MATKSILKTIYIRDNDAAWRLANALENASEKSSKTVHMRRTPSDASAKEIREIFGAQKSREA